MPASVAINWSILPSGGEVQLGYVPAPGQEVECFSRITNFNSTAISFGLMNTTLGMVAFPVMSSRRIAPLRVASPAEQVAGGRQRMTPASMYFNMTTLRASD